MEKWYCPQPVAELYTERRRCSLSGAEGQQPQGGKEKLVLIRIFLVSFETIQGTFEDTYFVDFVEMRF